MKIRWFRHAGAIRYDRTIVAREERPEQSATENSTKMLKSALPDARRVTSIGPRIAM